MVLPCPLPWPTPPLPLLPLLPEVGEEVGEGAGEVLGEVLGDVLGDVLGEEVDVDEQAVVLFWMDFPEQSRFAEVVRPRKPTERTIAAAMPTTITEYSTAVAPRSLPRMPFKRFNMSPLSGRIPSQRMSLRDQKVHAVVRRRE